MPFPEEEASNPGLQLCHQGFIGQPQLLPVIFCSNGADKILREEKLLFSHECESSAGQSKTENQQRLKGKRAAEELVTAEAPGFLLCRDGHLCDEIPLALPMYPGLSPGCSNSDICHWNNVEPKHHRCCLEESAENRWHHQSPTWKMTRLRFPRRVTFVSVVCLTLGQFRLVRIGAFGVHGS